MRSNLPGKCALALLFLLLVAFAESVSAQTKPNVADMRGPVSAGAVAVVIDPSGAIVLATLDPATVTIDTSSGAPVLKAIAATLPARQVQVSTLTAPGTSYTMSPAPTLPAEIDVARNGILLSLGVDYTVAGSVITFTAAQLKTGDVLRVAYR